jgi:amino acid/amide ABC transporter membrane protein 1, HAAT family (TC 3.A.1.4.-)
MLGLDPGFPLKYIVYFLIVVAVGGSGNIKGSLLASLMLGIFDVAGKYYLPQAGAFVIYVVMVVMLIVRPQGIFGRTLAK